jgi:hypothetical protein
METHSLMVGQASRLSVFDRESRHRRDCPTKNENMPRPHRVMFPIRHYFGYSV